ncbi:MAG: thrombospondin type 3 repeat-containing protein [Gammaproteobacteria bacterium]
MLRSVFALTALIGVSVFTLVANMAMADGASGFMPLTSVQRGTSTGNIGGSSSCSSDGSYNASTFLWSQTGDCNGTGLSIGGVVVSIEVTTQATLNAIVNNDGEAIGGAFFLRGTIPELGIDEPQLLVSGILVEAFSGFIPGSNNILALIALDFSVPELSGLGSLLYWEANNDIGSWVFNNTHWQTTATEYSGNFTGSQYFFFNEADIFSPDNDADGDGFLDSEDNCVVTSNTSQRDADSDGFGNACDTDLNNDCVTNAADLGLLRKVFFSNDLNADFNNDRIVNVADLGELRSRFFQSPGPSALTNACD